MYLLCEFYKLVCIFDHNNLNKQNESVTIFSNRLAKFFGYRLVLVILVFFMSLFCLSFGFKLKMQYVVQIVKN